MPIQIPPGDDGPLPDPTILATNITTNAMGVVTIVATCDDGSTWERMGEKHWILRKKPIVFLQKELTAFINDPNNKIDATTINTAPIPAQ